MFLFKGWGFFQLEQKHITFSKNYNLDSQNHASLFNCLSNNEKIKDVSSQFIASSS